MASTTRPAARCRLQAEPSPLLFDPAATALAIIDMQRDFLEPGGFGESLGNDVALLARAVEPALRDAVGARLTPTPLGADRICRLVAAASDKDAAWM